MPIFQVTTKAATIMLVLFLFFKNIRYHHERVFEAAGIEEAMGVIDHLAIEAPSKSKSQTHQKPQNLSHSVTEEAKSQHSTPQAAGPKNSSTLDTGVTKDFLKTPLQLPKPSENSSAFDAATPLDDKKRVKPLLKFHRWEDEKGINISSLLFYYNWFVTKGINDTGITRNTHAIPNVPFIISKNKNGAIRIKISRTTVKMLPLKSMFMFERMKPMMKLLKAALKKYQPQRANKKRSPPRHELTRIYQLIDGGYEIPFLLEPGDDNICSDNFVAGSKTADDALKKLLIPVFNLATPRECKYSFSLPTYLGIEHSKQTSSQWDAHFLNSSIFYPWEKKRNAAVWRGSNTGSRRNAFNREWLEEQGKRNNFTIIDARLADRLHRGHGMKFDDFQKYKAIIDIDGNGWSGRFHKLLCMNSVVIKMKPGWVDYNMDLMLKPWVHYIPATPYGKPEDFNSSLPEVVKFVSAKENEQTVKNIIANANQFCRENLTYENLKEDVLDILASYVSELDRHDPTWQKRWMQESNYSSFDNILLYKDF